MKIFNWKELDIDTTLFSSGTGISIGSFDGLHKGHRALINALKDGCKQKGYKSGVITFVKPLPFIKHPLDYVGDISTLNQRLKIFEETGIDFLILVDFDKTFASMLGCDFLDLIKKKFSMRYLVEGFDFHCGYKGSTKRTEIEEWAFKNNVETCFVSPVFYAGDSVRDERVSSSNIRHMIQSGLLSDVENLLERPFELDLTCLDENKQISQVLPPDGEYLVKNEKNKIIKIEIKNNKIIFSDNTSKTAKFVHINFS